MLTIKRLAIYLLTFVLILSVFASLTEFWRSADYLVYRNLYLDDSEEISLPGKIALIDIPHSRMGETFDRADYRKRLSDLLDAIAGHQARNDGPDAVVLDIFFRNEPQEKERFINALGKLRDNGVDVYGVYDMLGYEDTTFEKKEDDHIREIYENYFVGNRLHTIFEQKMGVLSYQSMLPLEREKGGFEMIEALAVKVARDEEEGENLLLSNQESRAYILPLGNEKSIRDRTVQFLHGEDGEKGGAFSSEIKMDEKILIVGSLEADYLAKWDKTGTHLLAWALYDQLRGNTLAKQPLDSAGVILGLVLFFSFFTTLIFALLFKYIRKLQTKPFYVAVLSFLASTLLLFGVGIAFLATKQVIPIGLPLVGILLSSILSWRFAHKFLTTGVAEVDPEYDIFISYSHSESDWVIKNVFEPLSEYEKPNGEKLKIFFDRKSIKLGEAFTSKYMWGIVKSKLFIPVMSKVYYNKNHCRNEIDLALQRSTEKLMKMKIIALEFDHVPEIFRQDNVLVASSNPEFIEAIKAEISEQESTS
jgi:hypothetical protein